MLIKNLQIYGENKKFYQGDIGIKDGKFVLPSEAGTEVIDGMGYFAIPGLLDIHFHGCMGDDFCDGDVEATARMAKYQAENGITSINPATMSLSHEDLKGIMAAGAEFKKGKYPGAKLVGINMEGPFINVSKKGAQNAKYVVPTNYAMYKDLQTLSEGLITLVDIAPEEEGALEFIKETKDEVRISIAHTTANYEQAENAFAAGATHVTHLYNAMPPFNHREPGVVGAAFDQKDAFVELICDGFHIHPAVVRATFTLFGPDRVVLISDSMRATGLPDGEYELGGQKVFLKAGKCTLTDGTIAGSSRNLMQCLKTAVQKMDIPLDVAVGAATINAAKSVGLDHICGSIKVGRAADLVLLDQDLNIKAVYIDGKEIK